MIKTFSMCPTCYKRIPATITVRGGAAWMDKECEIHGHSTAIIDPDARIVLSQYNQTTEGLNKAVLVPITDKCNMACSWCYTKGVSIPEKDAAYYDDHFIDLKQQGFTILLSGGEPAVRHDFVDLVASLQRLGWPVVTMSNMIKFSDINFMENCGLVRGSELLADFSMQHPANYSGEIAAAKYSALSNLEKLGLRANCIQFSIASLDELPWIRTFYDDTKHLYSNIRIRTLHGFWKDTSSKIYLSQLYSKFMEEFADLMPMADNSLESTNIYSIFMRDEYCRISIGSAPTVENIDLSSCSRPTLAVGLDGKYHGFPVAQIVSEGIQKGWYNGYKICANE